MGTELVVARNGAGGEPRTLAQLAEEIREHEAQAQAHAERALWHKVEIGKRLLTAKAELPLGEFITWGAEEFREFGWSRMHLWRHMDLARPEHVTRVLHLPPGASMRMALAAIREDRPAPEPREDDGAGADPDRVAGAVAVCEKVKALAERTLKGLRRASEALSEDEANELLRALNAAAVWMTTASRIRAGTRRGDG